jgi:hypothetical protein
MGQNMRLGSYGLDRVWSLPKLPTRLCGTNIRINCTSLGHFALSFMQLRNGPQCIQTLRNPTKHEFRLQWGASGAFVRKLPTRHRGTNFCINCTGLAHFDRVSCSNKMVPNAPKHYKTQQNMSLGSNGWMGCVCCEKFQRNFMTLTFALIAPVRPVFHRVSCSKEMIPNALKHYETHQNMSLGSNGLDRVHLLWVIPIWLHGMKFCINWTSSARFAPSLLP